MRYILPFPSLLKFRMKKSEYKIPNSNAKEVIFQMQRLKIFFEFSVSRTKYFFFLQYFKGFFGKKALNNALKYKQYNTSTSSYQTKPCLYNII